MPISDTFVILDLVELEETVGGAPAPLPPISPSPPSPPVPVDSVYLGSAGGFDHYQLTINGVKGFVQFPTP